VTTKNTGIYVVGISGSPRKQGNTSILVKEALRGMRSESEFISLAGLDVNPCRSCDRCWKEDTDCVIEDDIRWILGELKRCDAMILGSPCYFESVSAQLKSLMDRSVSLYTEKKGPLRNKIGAAVVTQDVNGRGGELVVQTLRSFYDTHRMIYAGSVIGEGGAEVGNIRKDERAMKTARKLAQRITELLKLGR
jgi:multimeric flavodoxin WrbA